MSLFSGFLPKIFSKKIEESYSALSNEDSDSKSPSLSDDEKETSPFVNTEFTNQEASRLMKQCFIYITISIVFIFCATTAIVMAGTAKCRANLSSTEASSPVPTLLEKPLTTQEEHGRKLSMFPDPKNTPKDAKTCGPNAAAAIAKGCHLDMISFTWLPHECYDAELTAEFISLKNWTWSLDANGTTLTTYDEVVAGKVPTGYVTWEYHLTHCVYTWKKLVRQLERRGAMDWYVMAFDHTKHCSKLLLQEGVDKDEYNSEFFVQYPACG